MRFNRKGKRGVATVTQKVSPAGCVDKQVGNGRVNVGTVDASKYPAIMAELGQPELAIAAGTIVTTRNETTDYVSGRHAITFSTLPGSRTRKAVLRMAHGIGVKVTPLAHHGEYYVSGEYGLDRKGESVCLSRSQWWSIQGDSATMERFFMTCKDVKDVLSGFVAPPSNGKHGDDKTPKKRSNKWSGPQVSDSYVKLLHEYCGKA